MATKSKKQKVKDKPNLIRDSFSKAIINTDRSSYANSKARKRAALAKDAKIVSLQATVDELTKQYAAIAKLVETISKKAK